jgi:hypothetical protein
MSTVSSFDEGAAERQQVSAARPGLLGRGLAARAGEVADTTLSRIHSSIERLFGLPMREILLLAPQERLRLLEESTPRRQLRTSFLNYAMLLREEGLCQLLRGSQICALECFLLSMDVFVRLTRMAPGGVQGLPEHA